jgi:hypothetical protein
MVNKINKEMWRTMNAITTRHSNKDQRPGGPLTKTEKV